ncbi:hypothetical protein KY310_03035 [Candidatus Woesearchaeota archaeon]|nr:hypothetical protein [Candidatus Woesearchaeota archaeon]
MERKYIFLIIAVILAIILVGMFFFITGQEDADAYIGQQYESCLGDRSQEYNMLMAEKTGSASYCKKLKPGASEAYCNAIVNKDTTACQTLNLSENDKISCRIAITKDASLCAADNYDCLAKATGDLSHCSNYQEEDYINFCEAKATLNAEYFLNEEVKTSCANEARLMAMYAFNDVSICEKITDAAVKQQCINAKRPA